MSTVSRNMFKGAAVAAALALTLTGCASGPSTPTVTPIDYKACMVSDAGGFKDASFNEEAYNGLKEAVATLGVQEAKVQSPETATQTDYVNGIQAMVDEGCNMIVTVGFNLASATRDAAKAHPEINFALIDSSLSNDDYSPLSLPNVKPIQYDTAQAAFLAGYLAASTSKSGKVSTYGGMLFPSVTIFMDGFKQGVDYYNSQKGASVSVLGADIVLPVAGPVGIGSGQATLDHSGTYVIGVDSDWYNIPAHAAYKKNILTSIEKKMATAVLDVIKSGVDKTFKGGDANQYVGTLSNGGVMIAPEHDVMYPAGVQAELDAIAAKIKDGSLVVKSIYQK